MRVGWSSDLLVVVGEQPALAALPLIDATRAAWIVIVRHGGLYRYAFTRDEVFERLHRTDIPYTPDSTATLAEVLNLHEPDASTVASDRTDLTPIDTSWRPADAAPSAARYVQVDPHGQVLAVGGRDVRQEQHQSAMPPADPMPIEDVFTTSGRGTVVVPSATRPTRGGAREAAGAEAEAVGAAPSPVPDRGPPSAPAGLAEDEGTAPIRHPSIEPVTPLNRGESFILMVDLLRYAAPETVGGPLALAGLPADWQSLEIGVTLVCPVIDFNNRGRGKVTVRRNSESVRALFMGQVDDGLLPGTEVEVHAQFWLGTRCCGSAVRRLVAADATERVAAGAVGDPRPAATGAVRIEPAAQPPDLTVFVSLFDRSAPGRLHWRMVTEPFNGLPPQLDGAIDLGQDPASEAAALFKQFAHLERGRHQARIEGFGERLWDRAPAEFRAVYWALHDHHRRPLTIQFVSDDPHLPWELMRPHRAQEVHPPLALRHAVARWIGRWHGYMRNRLPAGRLIAMAPRYKSASTRLSLAEAAAASLVSTLGAEAVDGTVRALQDLLEHPSGKPVALLYFTGHGAFDAASQAASVIKLQDGNLSVDEVARREVTLGERDGTLVFFNACEVGATAAALGTVGGWADAFLSRRFRAFIAPLWAIDEEDASIVTQELMEKIVRNREPVGAALRDVRARHGDVSPTFYSYLLYGDVTARLDAG